jgi:hypothetical protein
MFSYSVKLLRDALNSHMAKVIDVRNSDNELVVLGGSLVLPALSMSSSPDGGIRWNPTTGLVEYSHATVWQAIGSASSGDSALYDLIGYWRGQLPSDVANPIHYLTIVRSITLPVGLTGSVTSCLVAPAAAVTLNLVRIHSGTPTTIGTINFALGATAGTFTFDAAVTFVSGDIWVVDPPNPQDTTFAGLSWTIIATVVS